MKQKKKVPTVWEIWQDEKYIGTTESLQIVETALERGFKVVRVQ